MLFGLVGLCLLWVFDWFGVVCWVACCVVYYLFLGFGLVVVMAMVVMLPDLVFCAFVF